MGAKLLDKAIHVRMKKSHTALPRLLLVLLANFADDETKITKISTSELSRLTGFTEETIDDTLHYLDNRGYIEKIPEDESYLPKYYLYLRFFGDHFKKERAAETKEEIYTKQKINTKFVPKWMPHCPEDAFYQEDLATLKKYASGNDTFSREMLIMLSKLRNTYVGFSDRKHIIKSLSSLNHDIYMLRPCPEEIITNTMERVESGVELTFLDCYLIALCLEDKNKKKELVESILNEMLNTLINLAVRADENLNEVPRWEIGSMQAFLERNLPYKINAFAKCRRPRDFNKKETE